MEHKWQRLIMVGTHVMDLSQNIGSWGITSNHEILEPISLKTLYDMVIKFGEKKFGWKGSL